MAEKAFFFTTNGTGDGTSTGYTASEWAKIFQDMFMSGEQATAGVLLGVGSSLAVSGTSSPLTVGTGAAIVNGRYYYNDTSKSITLTTPAATTGGHIILRLDTTAQTVRAIAVQSTSGDTNIPALTQNSSIWEIRLASYQISNTGVVTLTDTRAFIHMSTKVSTAMLDDAAVTTIKIAPNSINTAKYIDGSVTNAKLADDAVTLAKMANNSVGTAEIIDAQVTTAKLADTSVTSAKIGTAVPRVASRQGSSGTDWSAVGGTNYTVSSLVNMRAGATYITNTNPSASNISVPVVFPAGWFSASPLVFLTSAQASVTVECNMQVSSVTNTGFTIYIWTTSGTLPTTLQYNINWLAIGPASS